MKCKDCARYPFCSHIHKPSDEACEYAIKRKLESEVKKDEYRK